MWSHFKIPLIINAVALVAAGYFFGLSGALTVLILTVLELTFSFDNAVVNAKILQKMSPKWQKLFLTVGILIAVFGMRLLFPLLVVAIAGHINPWEALQLGIAHPDQYSEKLLSAHADIAAFGGTFLLLLFLDWLRGDKEHNWLKIERQFETPSNLLIVFAVALTIMLFPAVWVPTLLGALTYLGVSKLDDLLDNKVASAGLGTFLYLEVLDASFSFDGVIGAFAVTSDIILIAIGLGIGAVYVRSLTVWLVNKGTLAEYVYLEHGAHWAIGALAVMLLSTIEFEIPDVLTGLVGVTIIGTAFWHSIKERRKTQKIPKNT